MVSMARAGQTIMGCLPRKRMRRHSFSIGEWKPLMTVTPQALRCGAARTPGDRVPELGREGPHTWGRVLCGSGGESAIVARRARTAVPLAG